MKHKLNNLKAVSNELASLIASKSADHTKIYELYKALNLNKRAIEPPIEKSIGNEKRIGIYKEEIINGKKYYKRDRNLKDQYKNWANVDVIFPKKTGSKRVIFLGESAARGLFLDPYYSPASILKDSLQQYNVDFDIIDLAVTSVLPDQLLEVCSQSIELSPDYIVFFAGNNWKRSAQNKLTKGEIKTMVDEIASNSPNYHRVKGIFDLGFKRVVSNFFEKLEKVVKGKDIKILFVIPEFNLLDYQSTISERDFSFPNLTTDAWLELKKEGEIHLKQKDLEELKTCALEMIYLNPFHPLGYEWMAIYNYNNNLLQEAREYFEAARDTSLFRSKSTPRIYRTLKDELVNESKKRNIEIVDLGEVFKEYLNGGLPGQDLFLDYCHLTLQGIRVAMRAVAKELVKIFSLEYQEKSIEFEENTQINYQVVATSHFLAALHNAHWGQGAKVVSHHCKLAVKNDKVRDAMIAYLGLVTRKTPWIINRELKKFKGSGVLEQIGGDVNSLIVEDFKLNDHLFVDAIIEALKDNGIVLGDEIKQLRLSEYAVKSDKLNLLQPYFMSCTFDKLDTVYSQKNGYYMERDSESKFSFIVSHRSSVVLTVTARRPLGNVKSDQIHVQVNENSVGQYSIDEKWTDLEIEIHPEYLRNGVNIITINWPIPLGVPFIAFKNAIQTAQVSQLIKPVIGEIHQLYIQKKDYGK